MSPAKRYLCVYCGSKPGADARYQRAAVELGQLMVERGYGLVYGGGDAGLMGTIAQAVMRVGGEVHGVVPKAMPGRERAHQGLAQLHVVSGMHARKARMAELAHAFIAMPGGYGTLEELFEIITWAQLGLHQKPIGLLNVNQYYAPFVTMIERAIADEFIRPAHRQLWVIADTAEGLLDALADRMRYRPAPASSQGERGGGY